MAAYTNVRPLPPAVKERLSKLMLMLGSPSDGERASAAGMITTLLADHGLDWHDIVGSMGAQKSETSAPPPPPPRSNTNPGYMDSEELRALIHTIERSPLNTRARQFLASMRDRADIYGEVFFSDKQWTWFQDLRKRAEAYNAE
jgi:hypothetical protein